MSIYGYMSKEDEQTRKTLLGLGAEEERIYVDDGGTAAYGEMLAKLERGDVLAIKSLGALGKNYDGILHEWAYITQVKGADIVVLDMPLLDTRTKVGDLTGRLVSETVMEVLSFAAAREHTTSERQAEGIRAARERGVRFGRPASAYTPKFIDTVERFRSHEITIDEALTLTSMKRSNFYYHMNRLKELGVIGA